MLSHGLVVDEIHELPEPAVDEIPDMTDLDEMDDTLDLPDTPNRLAVCVPSVRSDDQSG